MSLIEKIVAGAFILAAIVGIYLAIKKSKITIIPGPDSPADDPLDKKDKR